MPRRHGVVRLVAVLSTGRDSKEVRGAAFANTLTEDDSMTRRAIPKIWVPLRPQVHGPCMRLPTTGPRHIKSPQKVADWLGIPMPLFYLFLEAGAVHGPITKKGKLAWDVRHYERRMDMLSQTKVYFIRFGDVIKIGWSNDVARRQRELEQEFHKIGTPLLVITGDAIVERFLHRKFEHICAGGELFRECQELHVFIDHLGGLH